MSRAERAPSAGLGSRRARQPTAGSPRWQHHRWVSSTSPPRKRANLTLGRNNTGGTQGAAANPPSRPITRICCVLPRGGTRWSVSSAWRSSWALRAVACVSSVSSCLPKVEIVAEKKNPTTIHRLPGRPPQCGTRRKSASPSCATCISRAAPYPRRRTGPSPRCSSR